MRRSVPALFAILATAAGCDYCTVYVCGESGVLAFEGVPQRAACSVARPPTPAAGAIAVGARFPVSVLARDGGISIFPDAPLPVDAVSSDESVIRIEEPGAAVASFVMVAVGPGAARISVVDGSPTPTDSFTVRVREVDRVALAATSSDTEIPAHWTPACAPADVALLADTPAAVHGVMFSGDELLAGNARLLGVGAEGMLPVGAAGTQMVDVELPDGRTTTIEAVVVADVERIERASALSALRRPTLPVGGGAALCFRAVAAERYVVGATFTYEGDEGMTVDAALECAFVSAETEGTHTLTVRSGGATRAQPVEVVGR